MPPVGPDTGSPSSSPLSPGAYDSSGGSTSSLMRLRSGSSSSISLRSSMRSGTVSRVFCAVRPKNGAAEHWQYGRRKLLARVQFRCLYHAGQQYLSGQAGWPKWVRSKIVAPRVGVPFWFATGQRRPAVDETCGPIGRRCAPVAMAMGIDLFARRAASLPEAAPTRSRSD
jgi:hypothetical protein